MFPFLTSFSCSKTPIHYWNGISLPFATLVLLVLAFQLPGSGRTNPLDDLVDGPVELLAEGFQFTEGPLWLASGTLLFSDIRANRIYVWNDDGSPLGSVSIFLSAPASTNGLTLDRENRILICEPTRFQITRLDPDGSLTPVVSSYDGSPFNSPNDLVVHSSGRIYFTDPDYTCATCPKNQPVQGVYSFDPGGTITLEIADMIRPNGLAFSPDESLLYVGSVRDSYINVYTMDAEGRATEGRLFCQATHPDGMKVDRDGRLWVSVDEGLAVFDPSGALLGTLTIGSLSTNTTNLAFGGADYRTVFITAATQLYRVRARHPGIPAGPAWPLRHPEGWIAR